MTAGCLGGAPCTGFDCWSALLPLRAREADARKPHEEVSLDDTAAAAGKGRVALGSVEALRALAAIDHVPAISEIVRRPGAEAAHWGVALQYPGAASSAERAEAQTAARLWEPAIVLVSRLRAEALASGGAFRGARVLELGSGLGFVGLHLACLGAQVTLTDLPVAQPLLHRSLDANLSAVQAGGGEARAATLDWSSCAADAWRGSFDVVIASDPVFDDTTVRYFVSCLAMLLHAAGEAAHARVSHKHRPGVCCAPGLWGVNEARKPGGCALVVKLQAEGLLVIEEDLPSSIGQGQGPDPLSVHPFISVLRVSAPAAVRAAN